MQIKYFKDRVYGKIVYYVAEQHVKETISVLTRRKTLELEDIKALERLGHTFVEVSMTGNEI